MDNLQMQHHRGDKQKDTANLQLPLQDFLSNPTLLPEISKHHKF